MPRAIPRLPGFSRETPCLYVLEFRDRCKIGISHRPANRLRHLCASHRQISSDRPRRAVVSQPNEHARAIEAELLALFREDRLEGEYVAADFLEIVRAAGSALRLQRQRVPTLRDVVIAGFPRVAPLEDSLYDFAVEWTEPPQPMPTQKTRRVCHLFPTKPEAEAFCRAAWLHLLGVRPLAHAYQHGDALAA